MPTPRLGPVGTQRHRRAASRWLLPILVLMVVGGCAQPGTPAPGEAAATPATVTVGPGDSGKTVDLNVGDHLLVELNAAKQPTRLSRLSRPWRLVLPPTTVLQRVDRDSTRTRVVLAAEAPGTVRLLLMQQSCGPPLLCPMAAPAGHSERMQPPLLHPVAITVRVH
jgi:hypothetical protein